MDIEVQVSPDQETVWLTQKQIEKLFGVAHATVSEHITNILSSGELDKTSVGFSDKSSGGRKPKVYNLDMILSIGYRVNSKRGIAFRRWANSVLKQYSLRGYAVNERRLQALEKTVEIQTRMLAGSLNVEQEDVLTAVELYTRALTLLDQYDHQSVPRPEGDIPIYRITYNECRDMIDHMENTFKSDVFGVEKEKGKDHPFADGCKRIAASLFLEFLNRNNALIKNGQKVISDGTLVAIILMIAESDPREKDVMVSLVMNMLRLQEA